MAEAANLSGKFLFLDPYDVFCEENTCRNIDEYNRLIYSDANHLSRYGSRELIRFFMPEIKTAIQK